MIPNLVKCGDHPGLASSITDAIFGGGICYTVFIDFFTCEMRPIPKWFRILSNAAIIPGSPTA